jgi:hypothetical protein
MWIQTQIALAAALFLGTAPAALAKGRANPGGSLRPCSLDGVNPVYIPRSSAMPPPPGPMVSCNRRTTPGTWMRACATACSIARRERRNVPDQDDGRTPFGLAWSMTPGRCSDNSLSAASGETPKCWASCLT